MKLKTCLLLLFLVSAACSEKLVEKPENLIPEEKMISVLYDMALLDAIKSSHPQVIARNKVYVMDFLYEKYGIDSLQFVKSDLYYASIPSKYQAIYKAVEDRLSRERDSITNLIQEGKKDTEINEQADKWED
ncbi:DUF4296 domain-containing protein [Robiginitalea sp. IMCC43444]|uniref:DUF4296 domain-containing protein n=1 Tax=Robiginitalea sp. IMCC43444 TaxID=3459121 RepID=UPI00404297D9